MAEHAPLVFQRPRVPLQPRPYSWMTGGLHTFGYTNYGDVLNLSVPSVGGFEIAKVWDEHREFCRGQRRRRPGAYRRLQLRRR